LGIRFLSLAAKSLLVLCSFARYCGDIARLIESEFKFPKIGFLIWSAAFEYQYSSVSSRVLETCSSECCIGRHKGPWPDSPPKSPLRSDLWNVHFGGVIRIRELR